MYGPTYIDQATAKTILRSLAGKRLQTKAGPRRERLARSRSHPNRGQDMSWHDDLPFLWFFGLWTLRTTHDLAGGR